MPTAPMPTTPAGTGGSGGTEQPETGGAGGGAPVDAGPIVPMKSGNTYSITVGDAVLTADGPSGHITGLDVGGSPLFITKGLGCAAGDDNCATQTNYGASFWTAPQDDWDWPPQVDAVTYTHSLDATANTVTLSSGGFDLKSGSTLKVSKTLSGDAATQSFVLEYAIENASTAAVSAGPWEISRVKATGFAFFPKGSDDPKAGGDFSTIPTTDITDGIVWYDFSGTDDEAKSVADGAEGWLAYFSGGTLFVKKFSDSASGDIAPGHSEVEVYTAPGDNYVELECQGKYGSIAAGAKSPTWTVHWLVRTAPADLDVTKGSADLVAWVRSEVAK